MAKKVIGEIKLQLPGGQATPAPPIGPALGHVTRDGESEIGYYEGDGVEIADVAREQVLLWLPMQWVCQADCKGICPICGQNRNLAPCNCQQQAVDDRWSVLRHYHPEAK